MFSNIASSARIAKLLSRAAIGFLVSVEDAKVAAYPKGKSPFSMSE